MLQPPIFEFLSHFERILDIGSHPLCKFIELLPQLLIAVAIALISVSSILLVLLLLPLSLLLLALSIPFDILMPGLLFVLSDGFVYVAIYLDLYSVLKQPLHLLSSRLVKLALRVIVLLPAMEIIHILLSKTFIVPALFRLVSSVLRLLLLVVSLRFIRLLIG